MKHPDELRNLMEQHQGGDRVYAHPLRKTFVFTEGAKDFFENAGNGAFWLADILATEPKIDAGVRKHGFCVALLDVKGTKAVLTVSRDLDTESDEHGNITAYTPQTEVFRRAFDYTDCPEGCWKLYLSRTVVADGKEVMICMLPREY